MCPQASGAGAKYAYLDHDADELDVEPPILNQWYTVFDAEDVRLIWCVIWQANDENAAIDMEVQWTIDGNVYFIGTNLASLTRIWVYRNEEASWAGTSGLKVTTNVVNAAYYLDKRGHSFKVEFRLTSAPGTTQHLVCNCVRETLEQT